MLEHCRVLDLTDERGLMAGQILADLGADVIQVEPPEGSAARLMGPFAEGITAPENSLFWWAYARNKRSVTCDLRSPRGRAVFLGLLEHADIVIESSPPGTMEGLGLGYEDLARVNPRTILVSITAFGQNGPKSGYAATDLTVMAAGGPLALAGDPDRAPVRVVVPQAFAHACAEAAGAALIAVRARNRSAVGQHVDVSAQQAVGLATNAAILATRYGNPETVRASGGAVIAGFASGGLFLRFIWQAKDGHCSLGFYFGSAIGHFTARLMAWIYEEGGCSEADRNEDWEAFGQQLASGERTVADYQRLQNVVADFIRTKTKHELLRAARERLLLISPVATVAECVENEQLVDRGFWMSIHNGELDVDVVYPGAFAKFSNRSINTNYATPAPTLGQHNEEVFRDLVGFSEAALREVTQSGAI